MVPEPALLAVSRQVRSETLPIFYGANTFQTLTTTQAINFVVELSADKLTHLRCLQAGTPNMWRAPSDIWFVKHYIFDRLRDNVQRHGKGALSEEHVFVPISLPVSGMRVVWVRLTEANQYFQYNATEDKWAVVKPLAQTQS